MLPTDVNRLRRSQIDPDTHPDHPTWGDLRTNPDVQPANVAGTQTPPHSLAVPLAQAQTELSLITISSVSTATQMERARNDARGSPAPYMLRRQACCWARDGDTSGEVLLSPDPETDT
ncbi:Hypothetical predicted protein [Marmota monax]|uniref:Uncharacterized protein n=1 Tax=Marmota monax TaxID=9995 RepID=A0A5E4AF91_MARMO|nr:hypothetical protein GHT09_001505 [Marmota monax]VTJ55499.1 Hypothetical predicted protein [Marmota monax]